MDGGIPLRGDGKFCWGEFFLSCDGDLKSTDFDHLNLFKAKNDIL